MQDEGREGGTDGLMAGVPQDIVIFEPKSAVPSQPIVSMQVNQGADSESDDYEEIGIRIEQRNKRGKLTSITEVRKRSYDPKNDWQTQQTELMHLLREATQSAAGAAQSSKPRPRGPQGELGNCESLIKLVRSSLARRKRDDLRTTHEDTATDLGIPCRTLKRACTFHKLAWWPWPPAWIGPLIVFGLAGLTGQTGLEGNWPVVSS